MALCPVLACCAGCAQRVPACLPALLSCCVRCTTLTHLPPFFPGTAAHRLYKIALQRGFTRGRRTNQVAAACLYLICRQDAKPFLLIDFSDALQVNVFTLGAVFLQLAKLLRITEHPMFAKWVAGWGCGGRAAEGVWGA